MEHRKLGYHGNRKRNKVDNEVGKIVFCIETGQYEPKWEWEQKTHSIKVGMGTKTSQYKSGNGNKNLTVQKWEWEQRA